MSKLTIPAGYKTPLSTYEMQRAIEFIKSNFQVNLGQALNLRRVSAPLFVEESSGLNDNLNGVERPVSFDIPDVGATGQVVHSLAKWKRRRCSLLLTDPRKITRSAFSVNGILSCSRISKRQRSKLSNTELSPLPEAASPPPGRFFEP